MTDSRFSSQQMSPREDVGAALCCALLLGAARAAAELLDEVRLDGWEAAEAVGAGEEAAADAEMGVRPERLLRLDRAFARERGAAGGGKGAAAAGGGADWPDTYYAGGDEPLYGAVVEGGPESPGGKRKRSDADHYDYERLRAEYEETARAEAAVPGAAVATAAGGKIVDVRTPRNCSAAAGRGYGPRAVLCLWRELGAARSAGRRRRLLGRLARVAAFWGLVWLAVALPLWCQLVSVPPCWCQLVSVPPCWCQLVSVPPCWCQLVSVPPCWCQLVSVPPCWCQLVSVPPCWCQLVSVPPCWCQLVSVPPCWCQLVSVPPFWCQLVSVPPCRCQLVSVPPCRCQLVSVPPCWCQLVSVPPCWCQLVSVPPCWCQLVSVPPCWCQLVSVPPCWCQLVSVPPCWCQLVSVPPCWCQLVSVPPCWCQLVSVPPCWCQLVSVPPCWCQLVSVPPCWCQLVSVPPCWCQLVSVPPCWCQLVSVPRQVVSVPHLCPAQGWCCCCLQPCLAFCRPRSTLRHARGYLARNPPGRLVPDPGQSARVYEPSSYEAQLYRELQRDVRRVLLV
ncbi:foot protein 1 variant 2-like [Bacillus rossius redtenbacheri]|uniref:foot protein 1 variant 2-like n=1 Tax=Bacillus rossius redtenbacheri TaxID=93214 RepID=UPI002FDD23C4